MRFAFTVLLSFVSIPSVAAAEPWTLVAWAPGYPGTHEQAQPSMDEFAAGVAAAAGWPAADLRAVYHPEVEAGRDRVAAADTALAVVPLPVYLEYGETLGLRPLLRVIQQGGGQERWSLVARKGAIGKPTDLSGWSLEGLAGFSPRFVRGVLAGWGALPEEVDIAFNGRVLSALRRAARGEPVATLLDRAQAEALERLPFAADLEVVTVSAPTISSLLCAVGQRLPADRERALVETLPALDGSASGDELLAVIRVVRFEPLDDGALASARRLWGDAGD